MPKPIIKLWDIETSHNLAAVFNLVHNDYINPENIVQERFIISAAYKNLGEKNVDAVSILDDPKRFKKDFTDDFHVVKHLHGILSEADVIIAHNGDQYDIKFTEGRMLFHDLPALPPILSIDTLKESRKRFHLNSHKLDYLARFLKVGAKKHTSSGLWLRVLQGDVAAIKEMVVYNKEDVNVLERVYLKLRPYMAQHINMNMLGETGCPKCGSDQYIRRGEHKALTNTYHRLQCKSCGGWFRELKSSNIKKVQFRNI